VSGIAALAARRRLRRNSLSARIEGRAAPALVPAEPEPTGLASITTAFADESAEIVIGILDEICPPPGGQSGSYSSRHRLPDSDVVVRRPDVSRAAGRHAAPSAGIGRIAKLGSPVIAVRD
jgi:hypothetical protein